MENLEKRVVGGLELLASLRIDYLPKTPNSIGRSHYMVKHKEAKLCQTLVMEQCGLKRISGLGLKKAALVCTRFSCKEPDFDNLASSFKHVIDGLVRANVIADDKPSIIGSPNFYWRQAARGKGFITIDLYLVPDDICTSA